MKALYVTAFPPGNRPGSGAGEQISYVRIQTLNKVYDRIDILVVSHIQVPQHELSMELGCNVISLLTPVCDVVYEQHIRIFTRGQFALRDTRSARDGIANLVKQHDYDVAYFDFSQTFCFVDLVETIPRRICYVHDVISQRNSRAISVLRFFLGSLRRLEGQLLNKFTEVIVLCKKDQDLLAREYGVQSHVDSWEELLFKEQPASSSFSPGAPEEREDIIYFGNFKRADNWLPLLILTGHLIFESLAQWRFPERPVCAIGFAPRWLRFLGHFLPQFLFISGYLDNPAETLGRAAVFIAPLISGAGVKIKIKEYQRFEVPILGTPIAFEGIKVRPMDLELSFWDCARMIRCLSCLPADDYAKALCSGLLDFWGQGTVGKAKFSCK
jgi:hypothetical protein